MASAVVGSVPGRRDRISTLISSICWHIASLARIVKREGFIRSSLWLRPSGQKKDPAAEQRGRWIGSDDHCGRVEKTAAKSRTALSERPTNVVRCYLGANSLKARGSWLQNSVDRRSPNTELSGDLGCSKSIRSKGFYPLCIDTRFPSLVDTFGFRLGNTLKLSFTT